MEMATKFLSFSFNNIIHRKIGGVSMGSPLGPVMADIFVRFQEKQMSDELSKTYCYVRYVDDILASFISHSRAKWFKQPPPLLTIYD